VGPSPHGFFFAPLKWSAFPRVWRNPLRLPFLESFSPVFIIPLRTTTSNLRSLATVLSPLRRFPVRRSFQSKQCDAACVLPDSNTCRFFFFFTLLLRLTPREDRTDQPVFLLFPLAFPLATGQQHHTVVLYHPRGANPLSPKF